MYAIRNKSKRAEYYMTISSGEYALAGEASATDGAFPSGRAILIAVGFGCFLALQTYCGLSIALPLAFGFGTAYAVILRIVSLLAIIFVFVAGYAKADWVMSHYASVLGPAVAVGVVPFIGKAVVLSLGIDLSLLAPLTWAMLGISFAASGLYWCLIMSQNSLRQNVQTVAFSALFSVVIYVAVCSAEPKQLGLAGMALVIGAEFIILSRLMKGVHKVGYAIDDNGGAFQETGREIFWIACHSAAYGMVLIVTVAHGLKAALIVGACGVFGAALSVMANHWSLSRLITSRQVQQIALPFVVATLLLIPHCNEAGLIACAGLNVAFNSFYMVLRWCETSEINQEFGLHAIRRYSKTGIPNWIGSLVGTVLGWCVFMREPSWEAAASYVLIGLSFVLLLSFAIFSFGEIRRYDEVPLAPSSAASGERSQDGSFMQSCKKVAHEHGLTPRETEVFILLAKGRNAEFIEKKLVVSHSTARSHIYNIYKKLGISSHQLLINMVEDEKR